MSFHTCPIATVHAPVEQVWRLLLDPSRYAQWWDARTISTLPDGPARAGQAIVASTKALGRTWMVHVTVQSVDPEKRQIDLLTQLPLGITVHNHITCLPLDPEQTRVSFG